MPSIRPFRAAVALAFAAAAPLVPHPAFAQTVPTDFSVDLVIWNFGGEPSAFTFLPDGRTVALERTTGNVRLAAAGASTASVIATIPNLTTEDERGLLGVAVDPAWPTRPYLYFSYTRTDTMSVIVMYTAAGALSNPASTAITLGSPYEIVETPDRETYHNGGTVRFGLDGKLYVTWGDDGSPCHAQDLTWLNGKMLRLDVSALPGAGSGPPARSVITPSDNPFVANPDPNAKLVFVWGLRNPFRFTIDRLTGDRYIGEVGETSWEEIDRIAVGTGGQNCGWPIREGPAAGTLGYTCGQGNTFTEPIYSYPHPDGIAVIGGPLYRAVSGSTVAFPATYEGSYFMLDWGSGWIRRIVPSGGTWVVAAAVPGQPTADHWGENFLYFSDFQEGPDGALYLMRHGGAWGLYRIKHTGPTSVDASVAAVAVLQVQPRPNPAPARTGVEFSWSAPSAGRMTVTVFDAGGRVVARLESAQAAARGVLSWNGRGSEGQPVAAGAYFYRAEGPGGEATGHLTVLR